MSIRRRQKICASAFPLFVAILQISICSKLWAVSFADDCPWYIGARPLGMGNAFISVSDDADAGFWNPAGIIQWQGVKVTLSTQLTDRQYRPVDSKCIAYSYRGFGFFWGNKITFRSEAIKDFNYYSFARKITPHLSVGGSIKFKRQHPSNYYQFTGYRSGYDLSFMFKSNSYGTYAVLIQDLIDAERTIDLVTLGWSMNVEPPILISVDTNVAVDDDVKLRVGSEYRVSGCLTVRMGLSAWHPTFGASIGLKKAILDFACIKDSKGLVSFLSVRISL